MAETRPRAGLLAGQERARRGAVVGDGGAGVSGRNKVARFFRGDHCLSSNGWVRQQRLII